jgi:glycosyltransferase involved in cell wall biosynthesis
MKVSAFTFIKNGQILGYPFLQSIQSILTIVDEFVINVGESEDDTLEMIKSIKDKKIRIIESKWNDGMQDRGYVYGQQKMIAQFNCTGDWVFYIEGDEVYHEKDLEKIKRSMEMYLNDSNVEALVFDFKHFYGNANSVLDSPGWYRSETRIIKNSIRSYAPDGLFWLVLDSNKKGRYPRAKIIGVSCYHYGWVRSEKQMNLKSIKVQKYWGGDPVLIDYSQMDQSIIKEFKGSHPEIIKEWLPKEIGLYVASESYKPTLKQKKHQLMIKFEIFFGIDLSKKHYKLLK